MDQSNPHDRACIFPGMTVQVIQKQDQRSGKRTCGVVKEILTNSRFHPHGIKVLLTNGKVGRVVAFTGSNESTSG